MALSDIVSLILSTQTASATREGYGTPLILAADAGGGFTERVRTYTDLTGLLADFAVTTATYKMAAKILAQETRPPSIKVGRLALIPTQRFAVAPTAANSTVYSGTLNGLPWTYTSDASALVSEIIAGMKAAIDALGEAVTTSDQTTYLRVVANAAGAFHNLTIDDNTGSKLALEQDHADPGVATDLAAIALEDGDWYCVLNAFNSKAMALAISNWVESNEKMCVLQTVDTPVANLSSGSDTSSIAYTARANLRTAIVYHRDNAQFAADGWAGAVLPLDPGSETWAFKTLAGVTAQVLTSTQRTNLVAKHVNFYETIAGLNLTNQGKMVGNEWIDVVRFRDWLKTNMQADILEALANNNKIPFTDAGIAVIAGKIRARLKAGVEIGGLSPDPAPRVTVPLASAVSTSDKGTRTLTGVKFDAVLAGAIQAVTISGTLTN